MRNMKYLLIITLIFYRLQIGTMRYHRYPSAFTSSIAHLGPLLYVENLLMNNVEDYIGLEQELDDVLSLFLADVHAEHEKALYDHDAYFANPLNSFKMIRRLVADWNKVNALLNATFGYESIQNVQDMAQRLPTQIDLLYALKGIQRLEFIYDLEKQDMANGLLNGTQYDVKLSAPDCFAIGEHYESILDFTNSQEWLEIALDLFADEIVSKLLYKALDEHIELKLSQMKGKPNAQNLSSLNPIAQHHKRGCRGEYARHKQRLYCRYNHTTTAFLTIAPLKMEELYLDPYIVRYHDVVYEQEIYVMRALASLLLEPSIVHAPVYDDDRVTKSAFLPISTNTVPRLRTRIADITGFDVEKSAPMEITNYGLGGQYYTHSDHSPISYQEQYLDADSQGNQIATVLIYLSDVEKGGATAFVDAEITVFPKKGDALLWYNLNNRGDPDLNTNHTGCPVLVGSKWVATQLISERRQSFRRPCWR